MSGDLHQRELILGVTGGIAAWKSAELCSQLVQRKAAVSVVMTESAHQFIGRATFEALTGRPVWSETFEAHHLYQGAHIGLAQRAELIVIAPATARSIGRLANGLADDLLSLLVLAASVPVIVAPAMNCEMWEKPAVQRNVQQLRDDGMIVVDPESGWLSCGRIGPGRMASVPVLLAQIEQHLGAHQATAE